MTWDPHVYARYAPERGRPFHELVARVRRTPRRVADLGCGDGGLTRTLPSRWPDAQVVGVDASAEMLRATAADDPRVRFEQADLAAWVPDRPPDLILSNAALHWVPDHEGLLARLVGLLAKDGTLAIQVPYNHDAPSHQAVRTVAARPDWAERFHGLGTVHVLLPQDYLRILHGLGCTVDLWTTTYHHVLDAPYGVRRWLEGTTLRPYLARLPDDAAKTRFLDALQDVLAASYPPRDGCQVFPFTRLFLVAERPG